MKAKTKFFQEVKKAAVSESNVPYRINSRADVHRKPNAQISPHRAVQEYMENMSHGPTFSKARERGTLQDAQLSQRDRAAGCVIVFAKSRRQELGDNILRTV